MATENLYTDGSEFKLPNGRRYRGYYHIHPKKGAMVGAVHVNRFHESLMPLNRIVKERMEKKSGVKTPEPPIAPVVPPPNIPSTDIRPTTRPTTRPATQRPIVTSTPSGGGGGGY